MLNNEQLKMIKYYHDQESMHQLAFEDPNALVIYIDGVEAVISEEFGDRLDFGFKDGTKFLMWRLKQHGNDLNALATELGYDQFGRVDRLDFISDIISLDENSVNEYISQSYDCSTVDDIYGGGDY